ncbi:MAG TPA: polysaccharide deacetylase family protein, partial [Kribbella sp.]|nr:polysaccharide deacetylase family protein [Kribbella sp.]
MGGAAAVGCTPEEQTSSSPAGTSSTPSETPAPLPVQPSQPAKPRRTAAVEVGHGPRSVRKVALTFHGNGDPALAERLLALAEGQGARISVLAVGAWLVSHPEMAARILHGRHDLGNHTMHHQPMRGLSSADAHREVGDCAAVLRRTANTPGRWFRASGTQRTTPLIRSAAAAAGYGTCVSYDVDGLDWQDPPADTVVRAVLDGVRPGSIVSLHLGHRVTLAALPRILAGLSTKRLQPVTLTEL